VIDLDQVDGFIQVRHAAGNEVYQSFSGEAEHPAPGEVIFADAANHVHARRWTFRQSRRSTVGEGTRRALIVSEGLHAAAPADVPALLATLEAELRYAGWAPSRPAILSAEAPRGKPFAS
jgi:DNA/RNA-binding domain of Phe-tRNA-synthetase-like protein